MINPILSYPFMSGLVGAPFLIELIKHEFHSMYLISLLQELLQRLTSEITAYPFMSGMVAAAPLSPQETAWLNGTSNCSVADPVRFVIKILSNPLADEDGFVYMSNVNTVQEMANMMQASRSYQTNVEMMNTAKQMLMRTLTIGQ